MALTDKLTAIAGAIRAQSGKQDLLTLDQMPAEIGELQPLAFAVAGNPRPESPKENTIWVDTDAEITSWRFSAAEPEAPSDGMVWFKTGTASTAEFNALKKNSLTVYPMSASQYAGGEWVGVTAKSYQDGAWVEWIAYLYHYGDTCDDITGGWSKGAWNSATGECGEALATFNDDHINIRYISSGGVYTIYLAGTVNKIDLTAFKVLRFTVEYTGGDNMSISVHSSQSGAYENTYAAKIDADYTTFAVGETRTLTLDISNLSGEYYILAYPKVNSASGKMPNWKLKSISLG